MICFEKKVKVQVGKSFEYQQSHNFSFKPASQKKNNIKKLIGGFFDWVNRNPQTINLALTIINNNILLVTAIVGMIVAILK